MVGLLNNKYILPTDAVQCQSESRVNFAGFLSILGYPVKLKDYTCAASQELLLDSNQDYVMTVGPRSINLIADQKVVLKWSLENIKSYESRPLDQNPIQKLLSIDTGRLV